MGLDVSPSAIGVALSDPSFRLAVPLQTIKRNKWKPDAQSLVTLIHDHEIIGLVVGWPLNMDGTEGPRCQSIYQFALNFLKLYEIPVCLWDERLSTHIVKDFLSSQGASYKRIENIVDHHAAAYILQGALDALQHLAEREATPKVSTIE